MDTKMTWILVADGTRARLFRQDRPGRPLRALNHRDFSGEAIKGRDAYRDRPGRAADISQVAPGRHAYEPKSNPMDEERHDLIREVMDDLSRHAQRNAFDALIVCAPPQTMHEVREQLPKLVRQKIVAEETKDYTTDTEAELEKHLSHLLAFDPKARRYADPNRPGPPR